jgi:regulator of sigma E protease
LADFRVPFVVDSILPGMGAAKGGMLKGDSIISVNGQPTEWFHNFVDVLRNNKDKDVAIVVKRDTAEIQLTCHVSAKGLVGIVPSNTAYEYKTEKYGFFEALPAGISKGVNTLTNYTKQLPLIFSKEGAKQIGGFGTMGSLFPSSWNWHAFWDLTALLSVILAFMNILPIPALDGGHVMFLLYEIVTRRKPSEKFMEYAQIVGMMLLLGLLLYANGNDIFRSFFSK